MLAYKEGLRDKKFLGFLVRLKFCRIRLTKLVEIFALCQSANYEQVKLKTNQYWYFIS